MEKQKEINVNKMTTPSEDGFWMPGEFEPHRGCVMIWPVRPGSWTNAGAEAKKTFTVVSLAISKSEEVWMLCNETDFDDVISHYTAYDSIKLRQENCADILFKDRHPIHVCVIPTDDAWARDVGPTFVKNKSGMVRGIDWCFNAWGGDYDGLYADWQQDDMAALRICRLLETGCYDAHPFVLEGGSIHSDGEGTVMVTETCLLSPGRNPSMTRREIEAQLEKYLGVRKVLWLPRGMAGDETNEHVDNICAFIRPGEVVLAWTDDEKDIQYPASLAAFKYLESVKDAKGRSLIIHKLPIPKKPVCITQEELGALEFAEGEEQRSAGERLAASYVNFYISNGGIILPQFGDENDGVAVRIMAGLFPGRKIEAIPARPIIVGGGNIHCITQQIPM